MRPNTKVVILTRGHAFPRSHLLAGLTPGRQYPVLKYYGTDAVIKDDAGHRIYISKTNLNQYFQEHTT